MRFFSARVAVACLATGMAVAAAWSQIQKGEEFQGFRVPDYDPEGKLKTMLTGERAKVLDSGEIEVFNFKIEIFKGGEVDARVTAPHCLYNHENKNARSPHDVRIVRGNMIISGTDFTYDSAAERFEIHTNAKVVIRGLKTNIQLKK